jgi:hypothetical protein
LKITPVVLQMQPAAGDAVGAGASENLVTVSDTHPAKKGIAYVVSALVPKHARMSYSGIQ